MKKARIIVAVGLFCALTAALYLTAQFFADAQRLPPERYGTPALVSEIPK